MADKSPRQHMAKKAKSLKEKRADKKSKAGGGTHADPVAELKKKH